MKTETNHLDITGAIEIIRKDLKRFDLTPHEHYDFSLLKRTVDEMGLQNVSGQFSESTFDLFYKNGFWISFNDKNGRCAALKAVRYLDQGDTPLTELWQKEQTRIYDKPNLIGNDHAPTAFDIKGMVGYSGEFVLLPEYHGTGISGNMVFLSFLLALLKYDVDWIYGLMNKNLAHSSFPNDCGYTVIEAGGTDWITPPPGIQKDDYLVAVPASRIRHRARLIATAGSMRPVAKKQHKKK